MSADNGIYIAQFKDGWRVCHAQAIDNLDYYERGSEKEKEEWKRYFYDSSLFATEEEAVLYAYNLSKEFDVLEYGVSSLGRGVDWD